MIEIDKYRLGSGYYSLPLLKSFVLETYDFDHVCNIASSMDS